MQHIKEMEVARGLEYLERIEQIDEKYRDVRENLEKFRGFKSNKYLATYAFSSNRDFSKLAEKIMEGMELVSRKQKIVKKRDFIFYAVNENRDFQSKIYLYFNRSMQPISEWGLRELFNELRVLHMSKGIIFSLGGFTKEAQNYGANRALNLIGKQELVRMLQTINVPEHAPLAGGAI